MIPDDLRKNLHDCLPREKSPANTALHFAASAKNGQAMVEFLAGLVAVLAIIATMTVGARMIARHSNTMVDARENAADYAVYPFYDAAEHDTSLIQSWSPGPDGKRHTPDDEFTTANRQRFKNVIVQTAAEDGRSWEILNGIPDNNVSRLAGSPFPASFFGLVRGSSQEEIDLSDLPAFTHLVYGGDHIEIKSNAWLIWLKGLYSRRD
ncbi:MAG: hypothetical protein ACOC6C_01145 [Verrucomicrobiota bacterium]